MLRISIMLVLFFCFGTPVITHAQSQSQSQLQKAKFGESDIAEFFADWDDLNSFYSLRTSQARYQRLSHFLLQWKQRLIQLPFNALSGDSQVDFLLLQTDINKKSLYIENRIQRLSDLEHLLPFAMSINELEEERIQGKERSAKKVATQFSEISEQLSGIMKKLKKKEATGTADSSSQSIDGEQKPDSKYELNALTAFAASKEVGSLLSAVDSYYRNRGEYEPEFGWWVKSSYDELSKKLREYRSKLKKEIAGIKGEDGDPLLGQPLGAESLGKSIALEWIPYSASELIAIARQEFEWCSEQRLQASKELGFEDNWVAALEHVKSLHVPVGKQSQLVFKQAREAIEFLDQRDMVTIDSLCRETWHSEMLSQHAQRTLPFAAYGGQKMLVAYPTVHMSLNDKLMSMKGNNIHFSRIVTPHELIPGHHLQKYMARRHMTYRNRFSTPFLVEGWALYWEMTLWDYNYARGPEDRIGMLFWRMHRCARIIVSLQYHLGEMSPTEMIDFLTQRVGLEAMGARSEVRRYIGESYGPLYQAAYMLGGLQLMNLRKQCTKAGWSLKQFHDSVLKIGPIPIELMRMAFFKQKVSRDQKSQWQFYELEEPTQRPQSRF